MFGLAPSAMEEGAEGPQDIPKGPPQELEGGARSAPNL